jgi:AcrR family transcriptional regulator
MTSDAFTPLTAERRRQQTREVLLQAAAQVFAEQGFHGATLDQVAAAAGFTKGAVYSNFKNKDDLFLALIESSYKSEQEALHETLEGSEIPPQSRLGDFVALISDELDRVPDNWGALYLEFSLYAMRNPSARERLNRLEDDDVHAVAEIIAEAGHSQGTPLSESALHQARLVTALFRGISLMRAMRPEEVTPALLTEALAFVARGLGEFETE